MRRVAHLVGLLGAFASNLSAVNATPQTRAERLLTVRVLDAASKPVAGAKVGLMGAHDDSEDVATWGFLADYWRTTDKSGTVSFVADSRHTNQWQQYNKWVVLVSAPDYLPVREVISPTAKGSVRIVRLQRGRPLQIVVRNETGKPLPHPLNLTLFRIPKDCRAVEDYMEWEETADGSYRFQLHSQFGLQPLGKGRYRCSVPKTPQPLLAIVHHPGFLRGFCTVISASAVQRGYAEIRLPKPSRLQVEVDTRRATYVDLERFEVDVTTYVKPPSASHGLSYEVARFTLPARQRRTFILDDVCKGNYTLNLQGYPAEEEHQSEDEGCVAMGYAYVTKSVAVAPTRVAGVQLVYQPPDLRPYRGDCTLSLEVRTAQGAPAAHQPYALYVEVVGEPRLKIAAGSLDSAGRATITRLKPDIEYWLYLGNQKEPVDSIVLRDSGKRFSRTVWLPARVGDPVPDVRAHTLADQSSKSLRAYQGKWLYVEFWATWCGPCREALERTAEELPQIRQAWGDIVTVVAISLDESPETAKAFLEQHRLWGVAEHWWAGEDGAVAGALGVHALPRALLIDPAGVIVWRGNPLEQRLYDLLKDARQTRSLRQWASWV